jgi:hypothetical protein
MSVSTIRSGDRRASSVVTVLVCGYVTGAGGGTCAVLAADGLVAGDVAVVAGDVAAGAVAVDWGAVAGGCAAGGATTCCDVLDDGAGAVAADAAGDVALEDGC